MEAIRGKCRTKWLSGSLAVTKVPTGKMEFHGTRMIQGRQRTTFFSSIGANAPDSHDQALSRTVRSPCVQATDPSSPPQNMKNFVRDGGEGYVEWDFFAEEGRCSICTCDQRDGVDHKGASIGRW